MSKDKPRRVMVTTYTRIPSLYMRCPLCSQEMALVIVFDPISRTSKKCDGRFYSRCACKHVEVLMKLTERDVMTRAAHRAEELDAKD